MVEGCLLLLRVALWLVSNPLCNKYRSLSEGAILLSAVDLWVLWANDCVVGVSPVSLVAGCWTQEVSLLRMR